MNIYQPNPFAISNLGAGTVYTINGLSVTICPNDWVSIPSGIVPDPTTSIFFQVWACEDPNDIQIKYWDSIGQQYTLTTVSVSLIYNVFRRVTS